MRKTKTKLFLLIEQNITEHKNQTPKKTKLKAKLFLQLITNKTPYSFPPLDGSDVSSLYIPKHKNKPN